jgi:hypothetical protein
MPPPRITARDGAAHPLLQLPAQRARSRDARVGALRRAGCRCSRHAA